MSHTNANGSQELPQASAGQYLEDSRIVPQNQGSSRSLTKSALEGLSGPKNEMLQRYLNQGVKEDSAVVFARIQAQR